MAFFKGNDVVLAEKLDALRKEFTDALQQQKAEFDKELEDMENALLARISEAEKTGRSNSLKAEEKPESEQVGGGYQTWSQRKASRVLKTADPEFAKRVLRRSQKPASANSNQP